ncbi:MAG TPA: hypothetical protein VN829_01070 [Dongiaceae bacterium]|nr:hypothetical protein [Dongiaceae bacterium]
MATPEFIDPVEDYPSRSPREIFARYGYAPVPPGEMDDRQLPGRLWELVYAAAARRFFFHSTNHLSDRSLYTLLWEQWLDEPTADIPLEAETNTTTIISDFNPGETAQERPPYDRDRFLPTPPIPLEAHAGWLPGDDDPPEDAEADPLGLTDAGLETAGDETEPPPDAPPLNPAETALEARLRAAEPENWTPPAQELAKHNIPLLPPAEITDEMLTPILWELLHNLAQRGFYVLHTDHVSDRELYAGLWERGLRDPAHLPGRSPRGGWFHDLLGSWGEDDTQLWLRYYASDEDRAKHAKDWPDEPLPPREKPCSNRDWRLPKGPF